MCVSLRKATRAVSAIAGRSAALASVSTIFGGRLFISVRDIQMRSDLGRSCDEAEPLIKENKALTQFGLVLL